MLKRYLLALAVLLLLCGLCVAQGYDGPTLPPGWLAISTQQLTELSQVFADLSTQAEERRVQLSEARVALNAARISLTNSMRLSAEAAASLETLSDKVRTLIFQRNIAIGVAIGAAVLGIAVAILF